MIFNDGLPFKGFMDMEEMDMEESDPFGFNDVFGDILNQSLGGGSNSGEDSNERTIPDFDDGLDEEDVLECFRENNTEGNFLNQVFDELNENNEGGDMPSGTTTDMRNRVEVPVDNGEGMDEFARILESGTRHDAEANLVESSQRNTDRGSKNIHKDTSDEDVISWEFERKYKKTLAHIESVITTLDGMDSDIPSSVIVGLLRNIIKNNSDQEIKTEINKLKNPVERRLDNID